MTGLITAPVVMFDTAPQAVTRQKDEQRNQQLEQIRIKQALTILVGASSNVVRVTIEDGLKANNVRRECGNNVELAVLHEGVIERIGGHFELSITRKQRRSDSKRQERGTQITHPNPPISTSCCQVC